jgi:hypothetical protein
MKPVWELERSPLAPGEGTWAVFAEKVVGERDEALAEVERLKQEIATLKAGTVEWKPDRFWGDDAVESNHRGFYLQVYPAPFDTDEWDWTVSRSEVVDSGTATTKEAAIEAVIAQMRRFD